MSEQKALVHNTCAEPAPAKKATKSKYWTKSTQFKGNKIYQRDDLFDVNYVDEAGRTNLQRMKSGIAPIGKDGKSINLHHMLQTEDGAIMEITHTMHSKYSKILHINPSSTLSGINTDEFRNWTRRYWRNRAKDFEN